MNKPFYVGCIIKVKEFNSNRAKVCKVAGYTADILGPLMLLEGHPYMTRIGLSHVQYDCRTAPFHEVGTETRW